MADATVLVQPPRRLSRKGGIKTVADFRTEPRLLVGALPVYDALPCANTLGVVELCYTDAVGADKVPGGVDTGEGIVSTFGAYVGVECFMGPWDDYADRARITLEQAEDRLVESHLSAYLEDEVTLSSFASYADAIGSLEEVADTGYIGLPVVLMSRADAALAVANFAVFPDAGFDGRLWTANGTPVLASGLFAAGHIFLTGGITVLQSEVVVSQGLDTTHNTSLALAERAFNIIIDCDYAIGASVDTP